MNLQIKLVGKWLVAAAREHPVLRGFHLLTSHRDRQSQT